MVVKKTMSDVLLCSGDNLILLFPTKNAGSIAGENPPAGRAFFFKVLADTELNRIYKEIMTAESDEYLDVSTGLDYNYLGESGLGSGNDFLRLEDDPWWLYHFGYAPLQDSLRVYPKLEIGHNITGWEYRIANEPDPTSGDDFGFLRGREVLNYEDPPITTETIVFRSKDEGKLWQFGFYNESDEIRILPVIYVKGSAYKVIPIINEATMRNMLSGAIPRRLISIGGLDKYTEESVIPKEWKAVGNEMEVTFEELTGVYTRGRRVVRMPVEEGTASRLGAFMGAGESTSDVLERLMNQSEAGR